jgi:hypothetical protein
MRDMDELPTRAVGAVSSAIVAVPGRKSIAPASHLGNAAADYFFAVVLISM